MSNYTNSTAALVNELLITRTELALWYHVSEFTIIHRYAELASEMMREALTMDYSEALDTSILRGLWSLQEEAISKALTAVVELEKNYGSKLTLLQSEFADPISLDELVIFRQRLMQIDVQLTSREQPYFDGEEFSVSKHLTPTFNRIHRAMENTANLEKDDVKEEPDVSEKKIHIAQLNASAVTFDGPAKSIGDVNVAGDAVQQIAVADLTRLVDLLRDSSTNGNDHSELVELAEDAVGDPSESRLQRLKKSFDALGSMAEKTAKFGKNVDAIASIVDKI